MSSDDKALEGEVLTEAAYRRKLQEVSNPSNLPDAGYIKTAWISAIRFRSQAKRVNAFEKMLAAQEAAALQGVRLLDAELQLKQAVARLGDANKVLVADAVRREADFEQAKVDAAIRKMDAELRLLEKEEEHEMRKAAVLKRRDRRLGASTSGIDLDNLSDTDAQRAADITAASGFTTEGNSLSELLDGLVERQIEKEGGRGQIGEARCNEIRERFKQGVDQVRDDETRYS